MISRKPRYLIMLGFSLVITLLVVLIFISASRLTMIDERHIELITERSQKTELIQRMRAIVRERSLSMYALSYMQDPFRRDEEFIHFNDLASDFIRLREKFITISLSEEEQMLFDKASEVIRRTAPLQETIVGKLVDEDLAGIDSLIESDISLEKELLVVFDSLVEVSQNASRQAISEAEMEYREAYRTILVLGFTAVLLSFLIMGFVMRRTEEAERALHREKELAEVTLHSIGDAVITLDANGRVAYLNPVAERLTGWTTSQAHGRPLPHVYSTFHEDTHEAIIHPAFSIQIEGQAMSLERHSLLKARNGIEYVVEDNASPIRSSDGQVIGTVLVFRDVTHARETEQQLSWQARHDQLTGLSNRFDFEIQLQELLDHAHQQNTEHTLLYMDLDQFKIVNDAGGHTAGDELLRQLSSVLAMCIRRSDVLARLGGDEFGVLLNGCDVKRAQEIAEELRSTVEDFRFHWKNRTFRIGVSIGLVSINKESEDISRLLRDADFACYIAKDQGRNRIWIHTPDDTEIGQRRSELGWITRIQEALAANRFVLYHQQLARLQPGVPEYHELLLRLIDEEGRIVEPGQFIPAAERFGIMKDVDRWVVSHTLGVLRKLPHNPDLLYAINISAQSFTNEDFSNFVLGEIETHGGNHPRLCFEITETAAISNLERAAWFIQELKARECAVALDDYGSGMSSFPYLKQLKVNFVKIDGSLITDICNDHIDFAMVETINKIAHELDMYTIAENVETTAVLEKLRVLGVDYIQGHLAHTPAPLNTADVVQLRARQK